MALTNAAKHVMLDELATVAVYVSLHTADPGSTGTSEVTGGSYTREAITWNAAASGALDSSNTPVFDVPAGTTVTHWGLWSAATNGTFYGGNSLSASEAFTGAGTYTLTDADVSLS
ncbi:phage tail fiber protein [Planobispora rosea]|uniref:phage tail fiber protein n=1 Tax=Planobispora rosea TaxID=35762 RepID=UPI000839F2E6|nr:hypothetical protein [Planobispora rosea]